VTAPLPDRWDDEPWPLDDPIPARGLRPTNWSDSHDQPPQVADLADEALQYALDHGVSMGRALAEVQERAALHDSMAWLSFGDIRVPAGVWRVSATVSIGDIDITTQQWDACIKDDGR
jgi:hypothetical protein